MLVATLLLILVAGCSQDGTSTPQPGARQTRAVGMAAQTSTTGEPPTATVTPTTTTSPTPTNTPTPTPTPTATALPALLSGDPRGYMLRTPETRPGAVCGTVDIFDFPVDPPDALAVNRGGVDYNRYRDRYNGFHAGEDWSGPNGRNLGSPVYSIAHGRVIYAHPNGWGVDQGTVIIRHVFEDGSQILSFYGHLDPPSVTLRYGDCVARGDKVGEIGDPRGRPHLHFEIRDHNPAEPGPGYWSVDPTLAGWFPPSLTIWESRIEASPGFVWARPPGDTDSFAGTATTGFLAGDQLVLLKAGRLQGIGLEDGSTRWAQPDPPTPTPQPEATPDPTRIAREVAAAAPVGAVLDEAEPVLYAVDRRGRLQAYATTGETPDLAPQWDPLWQVELEVTGPPAVYALPGGGVAAVGRREVVTLDANGRQQWMQPFAETPGEAVRAGDYLFLPVGRGQPTLWSLNAAGATPWLGLPAGKPVGRVGYGLWLYTREGVYRLDPTTRSADLVMLLPPAFSGFAAHGNGDAIALPDGGLLVAHEDLDDRRLLRFGDGGNLLWERSYRHVGDGAAQLALLDGQAYLALTDEGSTMLVTVFSVDLDSGDLIRLFNGGTRTGAAQNTWLLPAPLGTLLLNIGGGHMVALDPRHAVDTLVPGP